MWNRLYFLFMIVLTNNKIRQNVMTTSIYVVLNWVSEIKFVVHSVQTYWQKKETKVNRKKTKNVLLLSFFHLVHFHIFSHHYCYFCSPWGSFTSLDYLLYLVYVLYLSVIKSNDVKQQILLDSGRWAATKQTHYSIPTLTHLIQRVSVWTRVCSSF